MSDALQRVTHTHTSASRSTQYLTFTLANEPFAIPISLVREVVEFHGMTRIPLTTPALPGVLNLRGAVVPLMDLSVRFGRGPTRVGRRTCVVVVELPAGAEVSHVGLTVDSVSEALEVDERQLERRPAFGTGLRADFVAGMLNLSGRFVVVLEVQTVLSLGELEQLVSEGSFEGPSGQRREASA
jgi:purine-binding chemotaxis protein CheW